MSAQETLLTLATANAEVAVDVLGTLIATPVAEPVVEAGGADRDPLDNLPTPAVAATVAYADGLQGGSLLVMPLTVARRVAAAMSGGEPLDEELGDELSELELSAVAEAMNQMMAAAATTTSQMLEEAVELGAPDVVVAHAKGDVKANFQSATRWSVATIELFGESCRLIQFFPTVFAVRMTQALSGTPTPEEGDGVSAAAVRETLRDVPLRVWAELGRARLRTLEVASLGDGAIVELDHAADDPVDIYVNGSRIATGRLICVDDTDWAVRLEEVFPLAEAPTPTEGTH